VEELSTASKTLKVRGCNYSC
jgi:hypothetical protein